MVEHIKRIHPELHFDALCNREVLGDGHVIAEVTWSAEAIATCLAVATASR